MFSFAPIGKLHYIRLVTLFNDYGQFLFSDTKKHNFYIHSFTLIFLLYFALEAISFNNILTELGTRIYFF